MIDAALTGARSLESPEVLLEIRIPAQIDRIKLVRAGVEAAGRMCGLSRVAARDAVLAIDEACQNIIVHGYKRQERGTIVLTLSRLDDGLVAELYDTAPRIDPARIRHRSLSDVKPGKLGTYFMGTLMDRVEYLPAPGSGNLLRMYKRKDER